MSGLNRLCKLYGRLKIGDVLYVWDYKADKAVPASEMEEGSPRWKESERAKWQGIQKKTSSQQQ